MSSSGINLARGRRQLGGTETAELDLGDFSVPVAMRRNPRARRFVLRLDDKGGIVLTLPVRANSDKALKFARTQANWIRAKLALSLPRVPFASGIIVPVRGEPHIIVHQPGRGGGLGLVRPSATGLPSIQVSGEDRHIGRRVTDVLKAEAKKDLLVASLKYADTLDVKIKKISVRELASRWGSCSSTGKLSYSWRLILAPPFVLQYVAAHEIAHLIEMNHSARFWSVVRKLNPDILRAKQWIRRHGRELHRYACS